MFLSCPPGSERLATALSIARCEEVGSLVYFIAGQKGQKIKKVQRQMPSVGSK